MYLADFGKFNIKIIKIDVMKVIYKRSDADESTGWSYKILTQLQRVTGITTSGRGFTEPI